MACLTDSNPENYYRSIERIQSYPIINDSASAVVNYYQWIKSSNNIIDKTFSRAETTVQSIKSSTEPIIGTKLAFIDNLLCNQLEKFETSCPIILQPTSTITNIPSKVYYETFQPKLATFIKPVFNTINSVVGSSIDGTNYVLDQTDKLLNKYLPEQDVLEETELSVDIDIYTKIKRISDKAKNGISKKVYKHFKELIKSSMSILDSIQVTIIDIKWAKHQSALIQQGLKSLETIKGTIPDLCHKCLIFIHKTRKHFQKLQQVIYSSATSSLHSFLFHALDGISSLNSHLLQLQQFLSTSKPEFISDNVIVNTNEVINEIRIGIMSFVHNMKDILEEKCKDQEMIEMDTIQPE